MLVSGYSFISKVHRAPSEISALLRETANLNALLDQLQSLVIDYDGLPSSIEKKGENALLMLERLGVFRDFEGLMKVVHNSVKACEQIERQQVRNLGKRVMWPFKEKETKETMVQLGRLRETLTAAVVIDSSKRSASSQTLRTSSLSYMTKLHCSLRVLEETAKRIDNHVITTL